jgi:2-hydroxychromene-2-carboxylate isomerase
MSAIDFWFSIGSTYTYLSVMRAADVARSEGITLHWRPFNVRQIISEVGNRPFQGKPVKMAYMWRDIERRADRYGFPASVPAPYPIPNLDLANLVAVVAQHEGWCADYARATYIRWFQRGLEPGAEPSLSQSLEACGQEPERVLALARSAATESAYAANTDSARAAGVFGAPSFVVEGELFWGDDRLEDAVSWAKHGRLTR